MSSRKTGSPEETKESDHDAQLRPSKRIRTETGRKKSDDGASKMLKDSNPPPELVTEAGTLGDQSMSRGDVAEQSGEKPKKDKKKKKKKQKRRYPDENPSSSSSETSEDSDSEVLYNLPEAGSSPGRESSSGNDASSESSLTLIPEKPRRRTLQSRSARGERRSTPIQAVDEPMDIDIDPEEIQKEMEVPELIENIYESSSRSSKSPLLAFEVGKESSSKSSHHNWDRLRAEGPNFSEHNYHKRPVVRVKSPPTARKSDSASTSTLKTGGDFCFLRPKTPPPIEKKPGMYKQTVFPYIPAIPLIPGEKRDVYTDEEMNEHIDLILKIQEHALNILRAERRAKLEAKLEQEALSKDKKSSNLDVSTSEETSEPLEQSPVEVASIFEKAATSRAQELIREDESMSPIDKILKYQEEELSKMHPEHKAKLSVPEVKTKSRGKGEECFDSDIPIIEQKLEPLEQPPIVVELKLDSVLNVLKKKSSSSGKSAEIMHNVQEQLLKKLETEKEMKSFRDKLKEKTFYKGEAITIPPESLSSSDKPMPEIESVLEEQEKEIEIYFDEERMMKIESVLKKQNALLKKIFRADKKSVSLMDELWKAQEEMTRLLHPETEDTSGIDKILEEQEEQLGKFHSHEAGSSESKPKKRSRDEDESNTDRDSSANQF